MWKSARGTNNVPWLINIYHPCRFNLKTIMSLSEVLVRILPKKTGGLKFWTRVRVRKNSSPEKKRW